MNLVTCDLCEAPLVDEYLFLGEALMVCSDCFDQDRKVQLYERLSLGELASLCIDKDVVALQEWKKRWLADFPDIGTLER